MWGEVPRGNASGQIRVAYTGYLYSGVLRTIPFIDVDQNTRQPLEHNGILERTCVPASQAGRCHELEGLRPGFFAGASNEDIAFYFPGLEQVLVRNSVKGCGDLGAFTPKSMLLPEPPTQPAASAP